MIKKLILSLSLLIALVKVNAQNQVLVLDTSIKVLENGVELQKAWTGGFDCPMYSAMDFNNDGVNDLFVFDHKSNRITTFINKNQSGMGYQLAPQYERLFPAMHDWVKLYDYDCDGHQDIFTHGNGGIVCYRNNGTFPISFTFITPQINSIYHLGTSWFSTNIFVSPVNVPSFVDVDNDGDMDIVSFPLGASYIEFHRNYSMDSTGQCGGFRFYNMRQCWGYFTLYGNTNKAILPPITITSGYCPAYPTSYPRATAFVADDTLRHSGNILEAIDMEGDGDKDLLLGDIVGKTVLYIENGGNQDSAYAISQDTLFPSYNTPAIMENIAAPYIVDLNNDGKKDLLVSNFNADLFQGAGENYFHTLYYNNIATTAGGHTFQYIKRSFMADEMIDVGTGSHPVLFDADADGLQDLIVGSDYFYYTGGIRIGQLSYYRNTGTSFLPRFELVTTDYANLSLDSLQGVYPTFGDIDGDGDQDMIVGNLNGSVSLYRNVAGAGNPANFILVAHNYQNINVGGNGQQSTPQLFDLNKDGRIDLIIGKRSGILYYYENTGSIINPSFTLVTSNLGGVDVHDPLYLIGYSTPFFYDSAGVTNLIVGSYSGYIFHYNNIDNNLSGTFNLVTSVYEDIYEPQNVSPFMGDLNGDGLPDLIAGNLGGGLRYYSRQLVSVSERSPDPSFLVYPNPATDKITLSFDNYSANGRTVTVFNVIGDKVIEKVSVDKKLEMDLTGFQKGSYLIRVAEKGKEIIQKVILR